MTGQTISWRQNNRGRFARILFAAFFSSLFLAQMACAALQFDVFLGYDGNVREASWFPIVCEIKNDGPSFVGLVEVSPGDYGKGQTMQMPVELPTGTLKRIVIPAFASGRYQSLWNVRLLNERGKVMEEQTALRPRRQVGWEIPMMGSLSRTASGSPMIRPIKRDQPEVQPVAARFQPSIFPDNPLVLEGLDSIYLSSEVAAQLRSSQVFALISWMNSGGHLIVAVEQVSDVSASPWLRDVLPCEPKELKILQSHPELQEWLQAGGWGTNTFSKGKNVPKPKIVQPADSVDQPFADLSHDSAFEIKELPVLTCNVRDGRVVLSSGDTPLMVTAMRGQGRATALLFSPEREPFKSWKNLPTFWAKMAEVPGALYLGTEYYGGYGQSADGIFGAMIDSRQVHKLPITWLLLLLLIYLLVIGPLDRWWLNKIGRPMLTWITFPCYVVFFSLLIYFIGYKLRAGESEYNELHIVDVFRNGDHVELRGHTYASIYSPANMRFPLEGKHKFATMRSEFLGSSGVQGGERTDVQLNGDTFKAEVFVPVWTSQLYVSDWWSSAATPLDVKLVARPDGWQVTVQNLTDRVVGSSQLAVGKALYRLGEIPAGQTKTFILKASDAIELEAYVQQAAPGFLQAVQQRQHAFGQSQGGQLNDLPSGCVAASFLRQAGGQSYDSFVVPAGMDVSRPLEHGGAVLLAWVQDFSPIKPMNQFTPKRGFKHTFFRVPISTGIQ